MKLMMSISVTNSFTNPFKDFKTFTASSLKQSMYIQPAQYTHSVQHSGLVDQHQTEVPHVKLEKISHHCIWRIVGSNISKKKWNKLYLYPGPRKITVTEQGMHWHVLLLRQTLTEFGQLFPQFMRWPLANYLQCCLHNQPSLVPWNRYRFCDVASHQSGYQIVVSSSEMQWPPALSRLVEHDTSRIIKKANRSIEQEHLNSFSKRLTLKRKGPNLGKL
jgi:hypothetical protein